MSGPTQVLTLINKFFRVRDYHPVSSNFPVCSARFVSRIASPTTPPDCSNGLGYSPFARRYSGNHILFSFPPLTEMSHFSGCHFSNLCIQLEMIGFYSHRVPPFGYLWIKTSFRFPKAFRRLARPSSSVDTKASTSSS